jgi:hypothetical protein
VYSLALQSDMKTTVEFWLDNVKLDTMELAT